MAKLRSAPRARIGELELAARRRLVLSFVAMVRTLNAQIKDLVLWRAVRGDVRLRPQVAVSQRPRACDAGGEMNVRGLFETHLTVADLSRSVAFYRDVVGLPVALEVPERGAAFHWVGPAGHAMLGLWSLGSAPVGMQLHIAFEMTLPDVLAAPDRLLAQGIQPLSFFGEPAHEPSVIGWMPAAAVYFRDPDGHLLEYLAMLEGTPRPGLGIVPWSQRGE